MKKAGRIAAMLSMSMALSAVCGVSASAADKAFSIDEINWTQTDWNSIAMTNDDTVQTGAVIRAAQSTDSKAVGYLYRGAAVNVLDKGDVWTEVQSGSVTGYVMNDYLVYGTEAKGLAAYYGKEGVVANWNDVNVYSSTDAANVTKTVPGGTAFPLVEDDGHWLLVQQGADSAGYVSAEDATRKLLVDTAVPLSGEDVASTYNENLGSSAAAGSAFAAETDSASDASYDPASYDASDVSYDSGSDNASDAYDDSASYDASDASYDEGSDSSWDDGSDASYDAGSNASYDTGAETVYDASQETVLDASGEESTAADTEAFSTQTVSDDAQVQALYDAYIEAQNAAMHCTSEEDANARAQAAIDAYNAYLAAVNGTAYVPSAPETTAQTEAPQTEAPQTEASQTEAPQTEAPQTEAPQTEAQTHSSTGSYFDYSDLDLLAAIIWCEAGNQPYDGMVAVGEVVMNRVASPSFPNTIAEVLEQPGQFSPYSSGRLQAALAAGVNSTCYAAAQDALNGASPVPGALYFNTHSGTTRLGDHYFS